MSLNLQRFEKRPHEALAVQITNENLPEVARWCNGVLVDGISETSAAGNVVLLPAAITIMTLTSTKVAARGDWVVRLPWGEVDVLDSVDLEDEYRYLGDVDHPDQLTLSLGL